ncbi:MAG: class I SAM-dependent methyltransferase [Sphingobacteriales bacterium]|nr:class I SAM-dependent methyltransferase [Sphingobacteriales bacterium]
METLEICLCCGGKDFKPYLEAKDNYSTEFFNIVQCTSCGFIFTNPRPDVEEIGKYYSYDTYISHTSHKRGLVESVYRLARNYMKGKKLRLIQDIVGKRDGFSLLDFGCGTGDFLGYVKQQQIVAEGVEPEAQAREVAKNINKVDTYSIEQSETIEKGKFDVITLWHVLEHIHELHLQIDYFNQWLKPNGKLIIAVPNIESYDAKKYGRYWDAIDVPRHIYHYSPKNIRQIVGQHQFRFLQQYPLLLDAYYVSMRSEWHKGTNRFLAYFKAVFFGFKSNQAAKKDGNYSSLIYVFEKTA